jgi:hypothetical protein
MPWFLWACEVIALLKHPGHCVYVFFFFFFACKCYSPNDESHLPWLLCVVVMASVEPSINSSDSMKLWLNANEEYPMILLPLQTDGASIVGPWLHWM